MPGRASDPIVVPESLWQRPQMIQALRDRDIRTVFLLLRQYAGASQTQIAIACAMTQGRVSRTMKQGGRQICSLEVFERIADGLRMPDPARMTLGLAPTDFIPTQPPTSATMVITSRDEPGGLAPATPPGSLDTDPVLPGEGDTVRRRTFGKLAGASALSAILADPPTGGTPLQGVEAFAAALTDQPGTGSDPGPAVLSLSRLSKAVAAAKRNYQDCRYSTVIDGLPTLLTDLRTASGTHEGDDRLRVEALSAEAHHVAASILLKLDHEGLAWIAADRSMQAARNSQDLITIGSNARILTHALMNDGHYGAATNTAGTYAQHIDHQADEYTPDFLSVYGALLLRGAVAAGHRSDRHASATLLDEAQEAARRLGGDFNLRWTAFGPTNVQLHRVNIALQLGDAGSAIDQARTTDLDRIPLTERKATLLMDTSRALAQWGKHDKAYEVLRATHHLAPEEVTSRPSAHRMLASLMTASPPSTQIRIREFTAEIGMSS
ncbi:helix-turn-helix domain-containing protein [Actinomadura parmotrematis]|uniref:Helix-turn-helix domain-containing protein n=1 Tax=Actinomadura parmotrematis TaxID=2864039 RepID=A0ABS7FPW8_9ACTN|nr:helix-turn-helix transcriptional regulator [Actinomadura parmotrematis]MBW8482010.1 helix-turn-helix domain-containing protein [Actinomadura parmotrematis]